jgi:type I restriction enzyme S subunit
MGLKTFTIDLTELSKNETIRLCLSFVLPKIRYKYDKINNYLDLCESGKRPKGGIKEKDKGEAISLGGEQINTDGTVDLSKIPYVSYEFYESTSKGKVKDGDILICKDGALTGKTCFVEFPFSPSKEVMVNEHVYILRGNEKVNQKFLFYYTRNNIFQSQVKDLAYKKKAQPGLNFDHFKKIKIPIIPKSQQDQIVTQIEPIEKNIKNLKNQIKEPQDIINKIFAREFGFDENLYNEFGKGMTAGTQIAGNRILRIFETEFKRFSRSGILRFSTRFHNTPTKKLMNLLDCMDTLQVKDVITEPIHRGASPKYNSDGDVPVVKTGHLKNGYVEISQKEFVDQDFYKLSERSQVKENDILIASTGKVSLGKIDLLEIDHKIVVDGHISILRIDEKKYNRLLFTYFFRCILGYFQIERDYTGATNQIELYAKEISNFQIPDIPLGKQQKIVNEIKAGLDKQKEIKQKVKTERNKIDKIIKKLLIKK